MTERWSGTEFFRYNFGLDRLLPLFQHNEVTHKVRYFHPRWRSIENPCYNNILDPECWGSDNGHLPMLLVPEWVDDEVVFKVMDLGGRFGDKSLWYDRFSDDNVVYRVKS